MKYLLFIYLTTGYLFCNIWVSYNISAKYDINYNSGYISTGDYKNGSITFGYKNLISKSMIIGISYDIAPMKDDFSINGASFLNVYGKYNIPVSKFFSIRLALGYNFPKKDLKDFEGGLSYGIGINLNSGFGIDYIIYNLSTEESINTPGFEGTISRYSLSYSF